MAMIESTRNADVIKPTIRPATHQQPLSEHASLGWVLLSNNSNNNNYTALILLLDSGLSI